MKLFRGLMFVGVGLFTAGSLLAGPMEDKIAQAEKLFAEGKFAESSEIYKGVYSDYKEALKADEALSVRFLEGYATSLDREGKKEQAQKIFDRVTAHKAKLTGGAAPAAAPTEGAVSAAPAGDQTVQVQKPKSALKESYVLPSIKDPKAQNFYREAMAYIEDGSPIGAINDFVEACKIETANPELLSKSGLYIMDYGTYRLKDARDILTKLFEVKKGQLEELEFVAYARSLFLVEPLKFDEAETVLNDVLKKNAKSVPAMLALGELNLLRKKFAQALALLEKAQKEAPDNLKVLVPLAEALKESGKVDEARDTIQKVYTKMTTEDPKVYMAMAQIAMARKDPSDAQIYFEKVLMLDPYNVQAHLGVAGIQLNNYQDMSARGHLEQALKLDPGNPNVHALLGVFHETRGNLDEAVKAYQFAATYNSGDVDTKFRLAKIFTGQGSTFIGGTFSNHIPMCAREYNLHTNPRMALDLLKDVIAARPDHPEKAFIKEQIDRMEDKIRIERDLDDRLAGRGKRAE